MNSIWIATIDTSKFSFEAFGASHDDAKEALLRGLRQHATQCSLPPSWPDSLIDSANVRGVTFGAAYRDRELL